MKLSLSKPGKSPEKQSEILVQNEDEKKWSKFMIFLGANTALPSRISIEPILLGSNQAAAADQQENKSGQQ